MTTIDKALGLLDQFSNKHPEIGLAEFHKITGFDKATVFRYLSALRHCGFLEQNATTKAYRLGPAVIRLAAVRENTLPLQAIAAPMIDSLAKDTGELVHGALPQQQGMSTFYSKDGGQGGTRVGFDEAELLPLHATSSGIALLAFGAEEFKTAITENTLTKYSDETPRTAKQVAKLVNDAQMVGYAYANQSYEAEVRSVAMPFFSTGQQAVGTIAIVTPALRLNDTNRLVLVAALAKTCTQLTNDIGGIVPANLLEVWGKLQPSASQHFN